MHEIFQTSSSEVLRGAIVWTPMLVSDGLAAAEEGESRIRDARIRHHWDPDRYLGQFLAKTLNLGSPVAWDVYLLYAPGHSWKVALPPPPEIWMHQLDEDPKLRLEPARLISTALAMVAELSKTENLE